MLLRRTSLSPSFCMVFSTKPGDFGFSSGASSSRSGANSSLKVGALRRGSSPGSRPCDCEDSVPFCPSRDSFSCDCVCCSEGFSSWTGCVGSPAPAPPAAAMAVDGCTGALRDSRRLARCEVDFGGEQARISRLAVQFGHRGGRSKQLAPVRRARTGGNIVGSSKKERSKQTAGASCASMHAFARRQGRGRYRRRRWDQP